MSKPNVKTKFAIRQYCTPPVRSLFSPTRRGSAQGTSSTSGTWSRQKTFRSWRKYMKVGLVCLVRALTRALARAHVLAHAFTYAHARTYAHAKTCTHAHSHTHANTVSSGCSAPSPYPVLPPSLRPPPPSARPRPPTGRKQRGSACARVPASRIRRARGPSRARV
jgi:hypothetical protein